MITLGWFLVLLPIGLLAYAYLVYPAILWLLARACSRRPVTLDELPLVSIVVPAYNEESQIRGAIEALIAQDYPADRRQILILSDASTDRTDEIVGEYIGNGVELLRTPVRGGKTAAENASVPYLRGEIVINSDSSVRLHPEAVRRLVEAMADPHVGVASTRDVSIARATENKNVAEAGYVGYEMRIRALETLVGGIVGASGSGYAIRAALHRVTIPPELSRDFSAALTARIHGYSAVSVDSAVCFVPRTSSLRAEYRRKVRTISRGVETLLYRRQLLDPIQHGLFSFKLLSHKVARWAVPASGVPAMVGLAILAPIHPWAGALIATTLFGVMVTALGAIWPASRPLPRFLSILTFAVAANIAVVHALIRVLLGRQDHLWEPTRRPPTAVTETQTA